MKIGRSGEGSRQIFARCVDLTKKIFTACHLSRKLTLLVTSDIKNAASLAYLTYLWTHKKLI